MSTAKKIDLRHPFVDREVIMNLATGVVETLKMMADVDAEFEKPFATSNWKSPTDVSVFLSLNSGTHKGKLQFHFNKGVAKKIIDKMTGADTDCDSDEILDGVGEISNMFYGAAKAKLNSIGFKLEMTIPKPCWTAKLPQLVNESTCMLIPFVVLGERCFVEIILF